jgi:hypothetical protein
LTITNNKPVVEKITFSKEDQEDIESIKVGKPTRHQIQRQLNWRGSDLDVDKWIKHRIPTTMMQRKDILKKKYFKGVCHVCQGWPSYKLLYNIQGAILKEFYCSEHIPSEYA